MNITVIGTGYVGLVTGTCFSEMGNTVVCVDIDENKVKKMQRGITPIYEPQLQELMKRNIEQGRLSFTTKLKEGIKNSEIIFLALPTPPAEDGSADLSYVLGVSEELGKILDHYAVIVSKSTVPVGTFKKVQNAIKKNIKVDFDVVSNPEFLREGFAISDFMKPDRIIVGTKKGSRAEKIMSRLYEPLTNQGSLLYIMDEASAEMTKYAANAFLATKISFMNEIASLCELVGADADNVRLGIGSDERIGSKFLYPGIGYGGSCFPKDVVALSKIANENNFDFKIVSAVNDVNERQKALIVEKVVKHFGDSLEGKTIALWGLAFKPETDDIREAPALKIISELLAKGAKIHAYDPEASDNVRRFYGEPEGLVFAPDHYAAVEGAHALIIATEWNMFKEPDFGEMKKRMKHHVIFDGRNIYDPDVMKEKKFTYHSIGRKPVV
ncbi:UDP-glucose/GDP-mannose dehydrogenase family protein [Candidatus Saccharibacteria bacterium]|nr:UDP-glucose/GDP-mannose dehydrogenase family protein [Candidatus Saccharibacteria bacterium]